MIPRPARARRTAPALALRTLLALVVASALAGCGGAPWTVVHQANPNPFTTGAHTFAVAPATFEGLRVGSGTEAAYLAARSPDEQAAWEAAKRALGEHLITAAAASASSSAPSGARVTVSPLAGAADSVPYVVRSRVTYIAPGSIDATGALPCEVQVTVEIATRAGAVLDTFSIGTGLPTTRESTVPQRMERAGDNLGGLIARYVRERSE